jgi:hypothetical protein
MPDPLAIAFPYSCVKCVLHFPASALAQAMALAGAAACMMRLAATGSAAAGETDSEMAGMLLPAVGLNNSRCWLAPVPGTATAPLLMTVAAELTIPDIALPGNIFYRGGPDCAPFDAPGKAEMSVDDDVRTETHYHSPEEAAEKLRAMTPADKTRLLKVAWIYMHRRQGHDVLLQEACLRVLDGRRRWPTHVELIPFLCFVMKSISSSGPRVRKKSASSKGSRVRKKGASSKGSLVRVQIEDIGPEMLKDESPTVLDGLVAEDNAKEIAERAKKIRALFEDDPIALKILDGMSEGLKGEELRKLSGLSETAYSSKRKLIRRRLDKPAATGRK